MGRTKTRDNAFRRDIARRMQLDVEVERANWKIYAHPGEEFRACVRTRGRVRDYYVPSKTAGCAYGKNPRAAVAKALRIFTSKIAKRRGAFRGKR